MLVYTLLLITVVILYFAHNYATSLLNARCIRISESNTKELYIHTYQMDTIVPFITKHYAVLFDKHKNRVSFIFLDNYEYYEERNISMFGKRMKYSFPDCGASGAKDADAAASTFSLLSGDAPPVIIASGSVDCERLRKTPSPEVCVIPKEAPSY